MFQRDLIAGVVSGVVGWAGAFILPESSLLMDVYPGVVLALAFFWAATPTRRERFLLHIPEIAWYFVGCIAGWRLAIEVAVRYTQSLPYVWAGFTGGALVAAACLLAWRRKEGALVSFASITIAGGLGGAIFQWLDTPLHALGENVWVLALLVEWQTLVLVTAGWVRRRYQVLPAAQA